MSLAIEENVPLAPFTTIGIGGPARYLVHARAVDELREALAWAARRDVPTLVLGGGSNVLIADEGWNGLVVRIELRGLTVEEDGAHVSVRTAAGESWDAFVAFAVSRGYAGVECLSGIPGSCGATPIQNVGAYGQEVSETITRVETLDRATGRVQIRTNEDCAFGYRTSIFKETLRDRSIVLSATFRLKAGGVASIRYPELRKTLDERGMSASDLSAVRDTVIAVRKRKGMVLDPDDSDTRSDGSFFMNPTLTRDEFETFARVAPDAPHYAAGDRMKVSAAWLIERAGFAKGFTHGRAGLSTKHALAIVNRGGATAREVLELMRLIQRTVHARFGVELKPEVRLMVDG